MNIVTAFALVASLLLPSSRVHADTPETLSQCSARLATGVFVNAKARSVEKSDYLFQGIAAYVRVICVEQNHLADGLDKDATDQQIARGMNYANHLVYYPQLPAPELRP